LYSAFVVQPTSRRYQPSTEIDVTSRGISSLLVVIAALPLRAQTDKEAAQNPAQVSATD